ncbi:MAG: DUF3343 domain-containing protein [Candidatus Schekmanbacteria bacterium]|nr:MAG: DUF3343 domain-containing protein [Candidatus Schekmanbacteria bacterium]
MRKTSILVFETTHMTLKAEQILKDNKLSNMIVPKPKGVKSRCGVALKVYNKDLSKIESLLANHNLTYKAIG